MKTILYEIRYYLAVTLLAILLLPNDTKPPERPEGFLEKNSPSIPKDPSHHDLDSTQYEAKNDIQSAKTFNGREPIQSNK